MTASPSRNGLRLHPGDVAAGWLGALVLIGLELASARWLQFDLVWVTIALLATLGATMGVVIGLQEAFARGVKAPWARALIRASGTLLVTIPVARHLFDGAFASTLPGAAGAHFWFPIAFGVVAALILRGGEALITASHRRRHAALALVVVGFACDAANRTLFRNEYADIHTLLLCAACVVLGLGIRWLAQSRTWILRRPWWGVTVTGATTLGLLILALAIGLDQTHARKRVATEGMSTRLLVQIARGLFDRDGDGYSTVLGGNDCDDRNAHVHPGVPEDPSNRIDEDCDGRLDLAPRAQALRATAAAHRAMLRSLEQRADITERLAATRTLNIAVIAIDALRADVLNADAADDTVAHLHGFLQESVWFTHAFAPAAGTDLSMAGLLTGKIDPFSPSAPTLAMAAQATHRTTHAVIPTEVLRYAGTEVLTRGLDHFDRLVNDAAHRDLGRHTTAHRTTELGLQFVDRQQASPAPFWLWLHYFDVHEHHELDVHDAALQTYAAEHSIPKITRQHRYAAATAVVDAEIGRFIEGLKARKLWASTIVILMSDHGEGLGEAPRLPDNHGRVIYNGLVHVPLAIRIPGGPSRTVETAVSLLDVYPTLLALMGAPPSPSDGASLVPYLVDAPPLRRLARPRPLALNESDQYGLVVWPYKLIVRRQGDIAELYRLSDDFEEHFDRADTEPTRVRELRSMYSRLPKVTIDRTKQGRLARDRRAAQP